MERVRAILVVPAPVAGNHRLSGKSPEQTQVSKTRRLNIVRKNIFVDWVKEAETMCKRKPQSGGLQ